MKVTTCPTCGQQISIADETVIGQHIRCPYCEEKFSYEVGHAEFSKERIAYAIAECRKDSDNARYYDAAPAGARLYIGLVFYGKVFKDEIRPDSYLAMMEEVEPELKARDWKYLAKNETDPELVEYFRNRLADLTGEDLSEEIVRPSDRSEPMLGVLRQPATREASDRGPSVDRRLERMERNREAEANRQKAEWKRTVMGRVVMTACIIAVSLVAFILYRQISDDSSNSSVAKDAQKVHSKDIASASTKGAKNPVDDLVEIIVGKIDLLRNRKDAVKTSLRDVREDQRRLESELGRVIENGNMRSAEANAKGLVRLNGAETAMQILKNPVFNALSVRYLGVKPFAQAEICRQKVLEAMKACPEASQSQLEGVNQIAMSCQESAVGELRRAMDAKVYDLSDLSRKISAASGKLNQDRWVVSGLEGAQLASKRSEIEQLLNSDAFSKSCDLVALPSVTSASTEDEFVLDKLVASAGERADAQHQRPAVPETEDPTRASDSKNESEDAATKSPDKPMVTPKSPARPDRSDKASFEQKTPLVPSSMSLAMFKSGRVRTPTVFKVKVAVAARGYWGDWIRSEDRDLYWAVRILPNQSSGDDEDSRLIGFALKKTPTGKIVEKLLNDGAFHAALVKLHYDDMLNYENACVLDEIEPLETIRSEPSVKAKFTMTRVGITMSNPFNYMQGRISVGFRSKLKYFKKPILRIVMLTEENGSRVVRDCLVDEPNVKVVEGWDYDDRHFWHQYYGTHTTTRGNDRNEPDGDRRTVEDVSSTQSEVSGVKYRSVTYEGVFLGRVMRKGVKGERWGHVFGYSKFDMDENAKLVGYRIEAWHDGRCIGSYDTLNAQKVKRLQIPADWHVAFKYPEKFKYRSPFETKNVVRQ